MSVAIRPLYVKLTSAEHAALDRLAVRAANAAERPVTISEVVRQLIVDATARDKPVHVKAKVR